MALLRAPSQFSPAATGGPVTPSCCGCCCCCCCAGTAIAASIALPVVLHRVTRAPAPGSEESDRPRPGTGRRITGIVVAALTVPISLMVAVLGAQANLAVLGVLAAVLLAVGSYLLAGAKLVTSMSTPLLILLVALGVGFGELLLWAIALISTDTPPGGRIVAWVGIGAIPVITTLLLLLVGRRRRRAIA